MVPHENRARRGTGADLQPEAVLAEALEILGLAESYDEYHGGEGTGLNLDARQIVKQATRILRRRKLPWEPGSQDGAAQPEAAESGDRQDGAAPPGEACL